MRQRDFDGRIGKLCHLTALLANRKSNQSVLVALRMSTGNKSVEAFKAMHHAKFEQLFERPIDLQRRTETVVTELIEDRIGAERTIRLGQHVENERLIAGQIMRCMVMMVVMIAHWPAVRFSDASLYVGARG